MNRASSRSLFERTTMYLVLLLLKMATGGLAPTTALAAYNMKDEQINLLPGRSAGATFIRNDMMYIYGGTVSGAAMSTQFTSISINDQDGSLIYSDVPQTNAVPMAYSQAVLLPDNNRLLMFGGYTDNATLYSGKLLVYEYRFDQQTWRTAPALPYNNDTFPVNRKEFTATLGTDGKVYIAGGYNLVSAMIGAGSFIMGDLWSYDPDNGQFTDLSQPLLPVYMIGHTAIALSGSKIVFTMGTMGYHGRTDHPPDPTELCNSSLVYDIITSKWTQQELKGDHAPWLRERASAILGPDNTTIYFFGGIRDSFGNFYNPLANLAALDTTTWTWQPIGNNVFGIPPTARYEANAALLKGQYFVIANGRTETFIHNDVYMLNIGGSTPTSANDKNENALAWIENVTMPLANLSTSAESNRLGSGAIAGIVIGSIIGASAIGYILWQYGSALYTYYIWNPRTGEPWWTEASHLCSKATLAGLFGAFLAFLIIQVVNSPISTITLSSPVAKVQVPDIRFCFDGWKAGTIGCQTDTGSITDCATSGYLRQLNMTKHRPFFIDGQPTITHCYLFSAPDEFQLGDPKKREEQSLVTNANSMGDNGYRMQFLFYGVATKDDTANNGTIILPTSRIHVSLYPRGRNPNLAYYFGDTTQQISDSDIQVWLDQERNNLQTSNTYTLDLGAYSSLTYQLQKHLYLKDEAWNNVGFAPSFNEVPEITTAYRAGIATTLRVESYAKNILDVYPSDYALVTLREQKIYTVLSALGSAGGLLTLLITLDTFLFGVRPSSPWGVVHRWSMGQARDSLLVRLRNQFGFLTLAIPFINPVRPRLLPEEMLEVHRIQKQATPTTTSSSSRNTHSSNNSNYNDEKIYSYTATTLQQENQHVKKQLEDLQKRMQLMELMLKAYYINDEVFSNLHSAVINDEDEGTNLNPTIHINKKTKGNKGGDDDDGHVQLWRTSKNFMPSHLLQHLSGAQMARGDTIQDLDETTLVPMGGRSTHTELSGIQQLQSRRIFGEEQAHLVDRNI